MSTEAELERVNAELSVVKTELEVIKDEREMWMRAYERTRVERLRLLREMRRIAQQVDFACYELKDIDAFGRKDLKESKES